MSRFLVEIAIAAVQCRLAAFMTLLVFLLFFFFFIQKELHRLLKLDNTRKQKSMDCMKRGITITLIQMLNADLREHLKK